MQGLAIGLGSATWTGIGAIAAVVGCFLMALDMILQLRKKVTETEGKNIRLEGETKNLKLFNEDLLVLKNFDEVWKELSKLMSEELDQGNNGIVIKNIGLDLERIFPSVRDYVAEHRSSCARDGFDYSALVINPDSDLISPLINESSNIKKSYVDKTKQQLVDCQEVYKHELRIKFNVKEYHHPLIIHGVMLNKKHLMLGFTEIGTKETSDGPHRKMSGSDKPYIYLKYNGASSATQHYFSFFDEWFDYYYTDEAPIGVRTSAHAERVNG